LKTDAELQLNAMQRFIIHAKAAFRDGARSYRKVVLHGYGRAVAGSRHTAAALTD